MISDVLSEAVGSMKAYLNEPGLYNEKEWDPAEWEQIQATVKAMNACRMMLDRPPSQKRYEKRFWETLKDMPVGSTLSDLHDTLHPE